MPELPATPSRQRGDAEPQNASEATPAFPWWVRALAVCHVLSLAGGPLGFVVLMSAAVLRWMKARAVDYDVLELVVAGLACPVLCSAYRSWFVRWGRRRWPDGKYTPREPQ